MKREGASGGSSYVVGSPSMSSRSGRESAGRGRSRASSAGAATAHTPASTAPLRRLRRYDPHRSPDPHPCSTRIRHPTSGVGILVRWRGSGRWSCPHRLHHPQPQGPGAVPQPSGQRTARYLGTPRAEDAACGRRTRSRLARRVGHARRLISLPGRWREREAAARKSASMQQRPRPRAARGRSSGPSPSPAWLGRTGRRVGPLLWLVLEASHADRTAGRWQERAQVVREVGHAGGECGQ